MTNTEGTTSAGGLRSQLGPAVPNPAPNTLATRPIPPPSGPSLAPPSSPPSLLLLVLLFLLSSYPCAHAFSQYGYRTPLKMPIFLFYRLNSSPTPSFPLLLLLRSSLRSTPTEHLSKCHYKSDSETLYTHSILIGGPLAGYCPSILNLVSCSAYCLKFSKATYIMSKVPSWRSKAPTIHPLYLPLCRIHLRISFLSTTLSPNRPPHSTPSRLPPARSKVRHSCRALRVCVPGEEEPKPKS